MKPIPYLLILLSLFLTFSCEDDTPTNDDVDDMMSLDWILLKKGVDTQFYVESCDGYENCFCSSSISNECGECEWITKDGDDYYLYEYRLYWNNDLSFFSTNSWWFETLPFPDSTQYYDIVIPSHIPIDETNDCDGEGNSNLCEREDYFHPNCDTPLDTTMVFNGKEVSFEKMGWFDRGNSNDFGYIHYYPLDDLILRDGGDTDISSWIVVDYQRKE